MVRCATNSDIDESDSGVVGWYPRYKLAESRTAVAFGKFQDDGVALIALKGVYGIVNACST
jgi:hypothetical protein